MSPSIFERIQAKIELFRLEQRYTRRRNRRSTFVSHAIYVDGEYVYQTPNATGSSHNSQSSAGSGIVSSPTSDASSFAHNSPPVGTPQRKKMNRFSSMPGFGSSTSNRDLPTAQDWRTHRSSFDGTR